MIHYTSKEKSQNQLQYALRVTSSSESLHKPLDLCCSAHFFLLSLQHVSGNDNLLDAEKVYAECGQQGPLAWEQCILPQRMKRCLKIGEGTFGEVFCTSNEKGDTVALKVCTVYVKERLLIPCLYYVCVWLYTMPPVLTGYTSRGQCKGEWRGTEVICWDSPWNHYLQVSDILFRKQEQALHTYYLSVLHGLTCSFL